MESGVLPAAEPIFAAGVSTVRDPQTARARPGRPVRVLLICDHISFGDNLHGSGRMLLELAGAFDPSRVEIFPCIIQQSGELGRRLIAEGAPLHFLEQNRFSPAPLWLIHQLIRRHQADVVHAWDFGASTFGRLAAFAAGVPAIIHVRSHHSRFQRRGYPIYAELAYRSLAPLTARAVAISETIRLFAIDRMGFRPQQIVTLNNPAHRGSRRVPDPAAVAALRLRYQLPPEVLVIGAVTRFFPVKGIHVLLDAMPVVMAACPDLHLVLVGDGPERTALESQARRLNIADRVRFAGFRRDIEEHLALFTASVVPSLEEGMGNVAIESVVAGVPVVASREGGLPEVVRDGESGLLVPTGNAPALAAALIRLLTEPSLLAHLEAGCLRDRDRFDMDSYLDRLEALYRDVSGVEAPA